MVHGTPRGYNSPAETRRHLIVLFKLVLTADRLSLKD